MTPQDQQINEMSENREARSSAFLNGYAQAALLLDGTGAVRAVNAKGAAIKELMAAGRLPGVAACVAQALADGGVAVQAATYQKGAADFTVELTAVPLGGAEVLMLARDLSMEKNLRTALVESRQRYKDLVEVSSDFSWEVGSDGTFVFVSPRGALGHTAEALNGLNPAELVLNAEQYNPLPFLTDRPMENIELWMRRSDGTVATVVMSALPLFDQREHYCGARGICRDVSEDRANEEALLRARNREQLLNYIVGAIRDELNPADMLTAAAKATCRALGTVGCLIHRYTGDDELAVAAEYGTVTTLPPTLVAAVTTNENSNVTHEETAGDQTVMSVATRYRQSVNGLLSLFKAVGTDWTNDDRILIADIANQLGIAAEQVANHERILKLSRTDGMTGLFYVDMDNFKLVNDVHGHQKGDEAILALRDLMERHSRPGDAVSRLGGDEFAVWMDGMDHGTATGRAEALVADCRDGLASYSGSEEKPLGVSVGVAVYDPASHEPLEDLIARADAAMYMVKKAGKGGFHMADVPEPSDG